MKKISIKRLRNLTTGKLHTTLDNVQADVERFTDRPGVPTHEVVAAVQALEPWLREKYPDPRLWNGEFDPDHVGEVELHVLTPEAMKEFWRLFGGKKWFVWRHW